MNNYNPYPYQYNPNDYEDDDLDAVQLGKVAGGMAATDLGLPSFAELQSRIARDTTRDPTFLRSYFKTPESILDDPGFQQRARMGALDRGRGLQFRQNWYDDPRKIAEAGYQSALGDRNLQSEYFLQTYGFDPLTGRVADPSNAAFLTAAAAYGGQQAEAQRAAGMLGQQYGSQFTLMNQPGTGGVPYGYRRYRDEFGNEFLVDGRGRVVR